MLDYSKVIRQFGIFSGLDSRETGQWTELCIACTDELVRQIVPETDVETWQERLTAAAAALAFYRYALLQSCEGSGIKLGDLAVSGSGNIADKAVQVRDEFMVMAAPVLSGRGAVLMAMG